MDWIAKTRKTFTPMLFIQNEKAKNDDKNGKTKKNFTIAHIHNKYTRSDLAEKATNPVGKRRNLQN